MIILKVQQFEGMLTAAQDIAIFVNKNGIKKEDIVTITATTIMDAKSKYTIYYYGDSERKDVTKGFTGW